MRKKSGWMHCRFTFPGGGPVRRVSGALSPQVQVSSPPVLTGGSLKTPIDVSVSELVYPLPPPVGGDKTPPSSVFLRQTTLRETLVIQSALTGDEGAFEALFLRHRRTILYLCLQYSNGDRDQAHDLCQETFITAFLHLKRLRDQARFAHWISEIARNKCLSFARKQRAVVKTLQAYEVLKPVMTDNQPRWTEEEIELINELIRGMDNPALQETIRLFYIEGRKTAEIATAQGISQTAVTTRLNRFRTKFRKRMAQEILKRQAQQE